MLKFDTFKPWKPKILLFFIQNREKKLINYITKGKKLIDVYYFIAPLKQNLNPVIYTKQQKLFDRLKKAGYRVILCKRRKRDSEEGKEFHKIKEDDIRLALQMQKDAYENKFDTAFLLAGMGILFPCRNFLRKKARR